MLSGLHLTALTESDLTLFEQSWAQTKTRIDAEKEARKKCRVCKTEQAVVVLYPCRHKTACVACGPTLTKCPACGKPFIDQMTTEPELS